MSKTKVMIRTAMLGMALVSSMSWAGWTTYDEGNPHAAADSGTLHIVDQQAANTWEDWYWKGHENGYSFRCNTQDKSGTCPYTVNHSVSTSNTKGVGGGVSAGGNTNDWFKKAVGSLEGSFSFEFSTTKTNTMGASEGATVAQNWYVEPIFVRIRRWQRGHFQNGWVQDKHTLTDVNNCSCYYHYAWTTGITYGEWTDETAISSPYHTFHFSSTAL